MPFSFSTLTVLKSFHKVAATFDTSSGNLR
jgi:hypothetical protein